MEDIQTIRKWIERFDNEEFNDKDKYTQCKAGWYDWFCRDTSLRNKTYYMGKIIKKLINSPKIGLDTQYVMFKNNCPISYPLYDTFRFANLNDHNIIYSIDVNSGFDNAKFAVYGRENLYIKPLFKCNTQKELVEWFNC